MMASSGIFVVLFMLFGGIGGNEALDYVATESYWKEQGGKPAEEQLIQEVDKPSVKEGAPEKAGEIRKLMVIRTLGEMKSVKAMASLEKAAKSEERFVAVYAEEAIAAIKGAKMEYPGVTGNDKKDLNLMPKDTGVFVHMKMPSGPAPDIARQLKEMIPEGQQQGVNRSLVRMQKGLIGFLEKTGNIRVDSVSAGVAEDVGDHSGWVAFSVRGEYDHVALKVAIKEIAGGAIGELKKGEVEFLYPSETAYFALVTDGHFVFLAGPGQEAVPLEAFARAIIEEVKEPSVSKDLLTLIDETEKEGNLWAAGLVTGEMKNVPHLKEFKTLRLESAEKGEFTEILMIGEGEEANKVQQALAALEEMHAGFVDKELTKMKERMSPGIVPLTDFLEGIEFLGNGDLAIARGKIKLLNPAGLFGGMFVYSVRMSQVLEGE